MRTNAQGTGLRPNERRFCVALLTAPSIEAAAQAAGISRRSAHYYLKKPEVRDYIRQLSGQAMKQATRRAVSAMAGALATLEEIHADAEAPASARVSAARAILENAARLSADIDILERIERLEEAQSERR